MASPLLLLVEGDPALAHVLGATLRYGGYDSHSAPNGLEALSRVRSERYQAILVDPNLPDLSGMSLIRMLRGLTGVPILVVSGDTDEANKIAALDAGADDFIEKPFLPGELLARLRAVLRRAAAA